MSMGAWEHVSTGAREHESSGGGGGRGGGGGGCEVLVSATPFDLPPIEFGHKAAWLASLVRSKLEGAIEQQYSTEMKQQLGASPTSMLMVDSPNCTQGTVQQQNARSYKVTYV
jgi:hypothetical protein